MHSTSTNAALSTGLPGEVETTQTSPWFYNTAQAAALLGMSHDTLSRRSHPLYQPDHNPCRRVRLYHRRHLEMIAGVMLGNMSEDEAHLRWQLERAQIGAATQTNQAPAVRRRRASA